MRDSPRGPLPLLSSNVIVLDQYRLSREAFRQLLEASSFPVIADGATLEEAMRSVRGEASPDLILHHFISDNELVQALPQIVMARVRYRGAKSVVLSDCTRPEVLLEVLRAGVEAILSRDMSADVLQRALELVLLGQRLVPPGVTQMVRAPQAEASPEPPPDPPLRAAIPGQRNGHALSRRECQILRHLVDGLPNKAIARELDISEATVKVHVKRLLRKTRMSNRTQAAIWALNNLYDDHDPAALPDDAPLPHLPSPAPAALGDLEG